MTVFPLCADVLFKGNSCSIKNTMTLGDRRIADGYFVMQKVWRCCFTSAAGEVGMQWHTMEYSGAYYSKTDARNAAFSCYKIRHQCSVPYRAVIGESGERWMGSSVRPFSRNALHKEDELFSESNSPERYSNESQLKALDSYFSKLQSEAVGHQSSFLEKTRETVHRSEGHQIRGSSLLPKKLIEPSERHDQSNVKEEIDPLIDYFDEVDSGVKSSCTYASSLEEETKERDPTSPSVGEKHYLSSKENEGMLKRHVYHSKHEMKGSIQFENGNFQDLQSDNEASDLYLISILTSINIGVFLFEIASPMRNSNLENLSLPLIYGAKINQLILSGEWWRLLTPMFLHSGFLHVALGCWVMLTFGPQVCRVYGPFTFFLIYLLGGIAGNFFSFVHTPEATVGGTGPVFAILGAWFIYHIQDKDITSREAEKVFQKAVIVTSMSFILNNFERIDDWTHLGAACAGIAFGLLTYPALELDNATSENGQKEGIAIVRQQVNPCRSLATFLVFVLILSSIIFLFEPELVSLEVGRELDSLDVDSFE